ncbi:TetR/AcrR family transcriptional regulator [Desulfitobacterium sp.]|uniref:TetR/AcrR family transcriptional regulator n=1 Tax=Desulfitobacterium sp. TaxID=49981 RepID=UPI002BD62EF6|nr:TetR/AcrR family transcriptional regulator [Desulfitobacterium sp.]HVJ49531.1 TetR/AcrR family transcriptional regulator [Desulfitobacterium sp.]
MNNTENPIAAQSKQWIMQSLVSLMETKPFQEITISEISENAQLVRRTFYRNFDSKEDVLQAYFNTLVQKFISELSKLSVLTTDTALRVLFGLCKRYESFFLSLKRSNMLGFMLEQWNYVLPKLHALMLDRIKNFPQTSSEQALEYILAFNVGGTFNIVIKWIDEGMALSPDELADIVSEFSSGSLIKKD